MKQVYKPYWEWEDWINGMWRKVDAVEEKTFLQKAVHFTGNHKIYGAAMREVITAWPITMLNALTNVSINRRAHLGHCACCYKFQCPEYITRMAWKRLTDYQRFMADRVAQQTIDQWVCVHEEKNKAVPRNMGTQMLFAWDS